MSPKFNVGEIVKVFEYYADGEIVKDVYHGVVLSIRPIANWNPPLYVYSILPNEEGRDRCGVQTAEEFAIEEYIQ